jgi:hypothetical protein
MQQHEISELAAVAEAQSLDERQEVHVVLFNLIGATGLEAVLPEATPTTFDATSRRTDTGSLSRRSIGSRTRRVCVRRWERRRFFAKLNR